MKMNWNPVSDYIFYFCRYIQPIWYFNLRPQSSLPYWVDYRKLGMKSRALITFDTQYKSEEASLRDAAYQAWHKGLILFNKDEKFNFGKQPPLEDEYRFVKKYYNPVWIFYVLFIRLVTFNNPFREFFAFFKSLKVSRVNLYQAINKWEEYHTFVSGSNVSNRLVSIVIPTLNRYSYLKDVLKDLELQDYKHLEVIVVDQTEPFQKDFYKGWKLDLTVIHQPEKALWLARNNAIKIAKGDIILLYDDDSRVDPNWVTAHIKCLDFFKADFSAGVSLSVIGAKVPVNYSFLRWADQFDTGNVMIRKEVFKKIGLFDRQFEKQRMGDGEFGLRAYLSGFIGISNPYAKRIHLKVESGGLRQMGSWDGFRPTNFFAPRPIPSVNYLMRKYFGAYQAVLALSISLPLSLIPYKYKSNFVLIVLSFFFISFLIPIYLYQIISSWRISTKMILEGDKIEVL